MKHLHLFRIRRLPEVAVVLAVFLSTIVARAATDTTAPSTVTGKLVSVGSTPQITIRWNGSSDSGGSGLAGYYVYRSGTLVGTTTATSYIDSGLNAGKQYCYTIVAYDNAGNSSSPSAQA